ncbi:MAG TPA: ion channel [Burkholderiaceae bacterium]|nr:ion channel [Burkholderiaceae bacterium]
MLLVVLACCLLVVATTVIHYEVLRWLNAGLPVLGIPSRAKLVVVILTAFIAHATEIALYGGVMYVLSAGFEVGSLAGDAGISLGAFMYFSAETYTSLGFGDVTPVGAIRLVAGVEALNGLLLIGWSASFTYIAMEKFWRVRPEAGYGGG